MNENNQQQHPVTPTHSWGVIAEVEGGFNGEPEKTAQQQEPVARPCHVFNVHKNGALTEWEPTTMAFALPDGTHALYTSPPASKPWVGLTNEEKERIRNAWGLRTYKAIEDTEAKLREKNA